MRCVFGGLLVAAVSTIALDGARATSGSEQQGRSPAERIVGTVNGRSVLFAEIAPRVLEQWRSQPIGGAALEHLIEAALIEQEAHRRGRVIAARDVDEQLELFAETLRQQSGGERTLDDELAALQLTLPEFRRALAKGLLGNRLMREDFGLGADEEVPSSKQAVWIREKRLQFGVLTEGEGWAAKVGEHEIAYVDWAWSLFRALGQEEQRGLFHEYAMIQLVLQQAERDGVTITAADVEAELAYQDQKLRESLERAGHSAEGVSYLDLYRARDVDPREHLDSEFFRANVLQRKLTRLRYGGDGYRAFYAEHREQFDREFGRKVRLATLFLHAADERSEERPRTFAEAVKELDGLRQRLLDVSETEREQRFASLARIYSEHATRARGGQVEPQGHEQLEAGGLPLELLDSPVGTLFGPVTVPAGCHLFWIAEQVPARSFDELGEELEQAARRVFLRELEERAEIEFH